MTLVIADSSLVTYALTYAIDEHDDHERSNWICNRISDNIGHLDQATLLHLKQLINDHVDEEKWDYLEYSPFKRLRSYIHNELEKYK